MRQADRQVDQFGRMHGGQRVVEHDLSGHRPAFLFVGVIHAVDPVVRPLRGLLFGLGEGVLKQRVRIILPGAWDGRVAGGGGQRLQIRRRSRPGMRQRVDVNKNRADNPAPGLTGGNAAGGTAVVMAAFPVIEDDRIRIIIVAQVAVQFLFGRTAAEIFDGGIDEPDANVILGARPTVGRGPVLHAGVTILVFHRIFVRALGQDALFLRMNHHAGTPVRRRTLEQIAIRIHRYPVKGLVEPGDVTALRPHAAGAVTGGMIENRVNVYATLAAPHGIADFHVAIGPAAGRVGGELNLAARHALDRDLGTRSAIVRRINGDGVRQAAHAGGGGRILLPTTRLALIMAQRVHALIEEGFHDPVALDDDGLDQTVVERPSAAVVGDGHRSRGFGKPERRPGGARHQHCDAQGHADRNREPGRAGKIA